MNSRTLGPRLSRATVDLLPADLLPASVASSAPARGPGVSTIVHFGVGAFHRSHQAVYLDDLLAKDPGSSWRLVGVGLLESDGPLLGALREQDCLFTVLSCDESGRPTARVVGSIASCLRSPADRESILACLEDAATKIVGLTITEGGYRVPESIGDVDGAGSGAPTSVFDYVVEGLRRRRERGIPPFTVMSCDNIEGNGDLLRTCVLRRAADVDAELRQWIADGVAFPNSMVDRITPVTTEDDRRRAHDLLGVIDEVPVVAEPFRQWIVEDAFPTGRPALELVGVRYVEDVRPFERMKLRLLNGAHQVLGYPAALLGLGAVHEAARDPLLRDFVGGYLRLEAAATVPAAGDPTPSAYIDTVLDRFASGFPPDSISRLVEFGSDRLPTFVVPVIRDRLDAGGSVDFAAHALAAWALFVEGRTEVGRPVLKDHRAAELRHLVGSAQGPVALLDERELFGDLGRDPRLRAPFEAAHTAMSRDGVRVELQRLLDRTGASS